MEKIIHAETNTKEGGGGWPAPATCSHSQDKINRSEWHRDKPQKQAYKSISGGSFKSKSGAALILAGVPVCRWRYERQPHGYLLLLLITRLQLDAEESQIHRGGCKFLLTSAVTLYQNNKPTAALQLTIRSPGCTLSVCVRESSGVF